MPLPSECSFDTESGICPDGVIRNVLIQVCSTSASSPDETAVYMGEDCYEQFLKAFEETVSDVKMYFYNGKWEGKPFINALLRNGYQWQESRKMGKGCWDCIEDPQKIYRIRVCNHNGYVLTITDDLLQTACSMEKAADLVRKEKPAWFKRVGENTKLHIDKSLYNTWYTLPESDQRRQLFIAYSRLDGFSQAMIARWLTDRGMHQNLTAASNGLMMALHIRYGRDEPWKDKRTFRWKYPPLCREMQDIVEDSLQGGLVWGAVGWYHGVFCHADYKSSYPWEYAFGKLFYGEVTRIRMYEEGYDEALELPEDRFMIWKVVTFDFDYIDGMMPCLSGVMCQNAYEPMKGIGNKKMRSGRIEHKLFTASYLHELARHYHITDMVTEEIWIASPRHGDFKRFIKKCFTEKERPELKGTMERDIWKRAMNAGVHGKTITKTHRERCTYETGERVTVKEVNEPTMCALIGFTGMMNARERLLRHCRMVIEAGHQVLMCDTDSMVVDCSAADLRKAVGDWFAPKGGSFEETLGRFEIETDKEGNEEFDEFKCWGLKRYCELNKGKYRKSAFAGMHDENQEGEDEDEKDILISDRYKGLGELPVDNRIFTWHQVTRQWNGEAYELADSLKHACAESVWCDEISYNQLMEVLKNGIR